MRERGRDRDREGNSGKEAHGKTLRRQRGKDKVRYRREGRG